MTTDNPRLTIEEFHDRIGEDGPMMEHYGFEVRAIGYGTAQVWMPFNPMHIRPGGTISGPSMFAAADVTMWLAVMGAVGWVPLAVTTNMSINFIRKPKNEALIADAKMFKIGARLAVGEVWVRSESEPEACAHVTGTYSIPPR